MLHTGVHYKAGTLKARLCAEGNRRMREYCKIKGVPINEYGKVIVARSVVELPALRELHGRAQANGVRARLIDGQALNEIEPCARTSEQALYVKDVAVVNPQRVMEALVADAVAEGIEFRFSCQWQGCDGSRGVKTSQGVIAYGRLVNCAGLLPMKSPVPSVWEHTIAFSPFAGGFIVYGLKRACACTVTSIRMLKKSASFVLASLRGSTYRKESASPLRSLRPRWTPFLHILQAILIPSSIPSTHACPGRQNGSSTASYPVPDLRNPFLGVHFTRQPEGEVTVGPSALPLFGREQYHGFDGASMSDGMAMTQYLLRLFGRNATIFAPSHGGS